MVNFIVYKVKDGRPYRTFILTKDFDVLLKLLLLDLGPISIDFQGSLIPKFQQSVFFITVIQMLVKGS